MLTVPGEMTVELGRRVRASARAALSGSELRHVVVAGYANEYVSYLTTPEEYAAQHYEGGTTVYGPASGPFLTSALADLAGRLGRGRPRRPRTPSIPRAGCARTGPAIRPGLPPAGSRASHEPPLDSNGPGSAGAEGPTASTARSTGRSSRSSASDPTGGRAWTTTVACGSSGALTTTVRRSAGYPCSGPGAAAPTGPGGRCRSELRAGPIASWSAPALPPRLAVLPSAAVACAAGHGPSRRRGQRARGPLPGGGARARPHPRPRRARGGVVRVLVRGRPRTLRIPGNGRVSIRGRDLRVERGAARDAYGNTNARTLRVP